MIKKLLDTFKNPKYGLFKGTVSAISNHPPGKDGKVWFKTCFSDQVRLIYQCL